MTPLVIVRKLTIVVERRVLLDHSTDLTEMVLEPVFSQEYEGRVDVHEDWEVKDVKEGAVSVSVEVDDG